MATVSIPNPQLIHELALWIHYHSDVLTATVQRMSLKEIDATYHQLLLKSPYAIYQDCFGDYLIYKD
jgi:hypothetical protein